MLDTFIKNKGITKTIIHNNNKNYYNEVNWDADYDGEKANISLDIDENGKKEHVEMKMNNDELAELLNIPSENSMLDKRLYRDFLSKRSMRDHNIIEIEIPKHYDGNIIPKSILYRHPKAKDSLIYEKNNKRVHFQNEEPISLENEMAENIYTHISSPEPQEELLIPLVINDTKTRKQRHRRRPKTPTTCKVYRKNKHFSSIPSSRISQPHKKTLRRRQTHHSHHSRRTF
jgi:hypothetical protein